MERRHDHSAGLAGRTGLALVIENFDQRDLRLDVVMLMLGALQRDGADLACAIGSEEIEPERAPDERAQIGSDHLRAAHDALEVGENEVPIQEVEAQLLQQRGDDSQIVRLLAQQPLRDLGDGRPVIEHDRRSGLKRLRRRAPVGIVAGPRARTRHRHHPA